ncbi:MAG: hypothetical protein IJV83_01145 [Clostridia bacterium]|nr:hypothetical protein [Clostridia bacterium]
MKRWKKALAVLLSCVTVGTFSSMLAACEITPEQVEDAVDQYGLTAEDFYAGLQAIGFKGSLDDLVDVVKVKGGYSDEDIHEWKNRGKGNGNNKESAIRIRIKSFRKNDDGEIIVVFQNNAMLNLGKLLEVVEDVVEDYGLSAEAVYNFLCNAGYEGEMKQLLDLVQEKGGYSDDDMDEWKNRGKDDHHKPSKEKSKIRIKEIIVTEDLDVILVFQNQEIRLNLGKLWEKVEGELPEDGGKESSGESFEEEESSSESSSETAEESSSESSSVKDEEVVLPEDSSAESSKESSSEREESSEKPEKPENPEKKDWVLSTADDLVSLAEYVNAGFEVRTVTLRKDIDMEGVSYEPMFGFIGTFDGNGHSIDNLKITVRSEQTKAVEDGNGFAYTAYASGLFAYANGAEISDLTLNVSYEVVDKTENVFLGGLVGIGVDVTVENCNVTTKIGLASGGEISGVGGLFGYGENYEVKDTSIHAEIAYASGHDNKSEAYIGGVLGTGTVSTKNCTVDVVAVSGVKGYIHLGGVVGMDQSCKTKVQGGKVNGNYQYLELNDDKRGYVGELVGEGNANNSGCKVKVTTTEKQLTDFDLSKFPREWLQYIL